MVIDANRDLSAVGPEYAKSKDAILRMAKDAAAASGTT